MRSAAKKSSILDATRNLLVERGGPHLTMRKVADRAGISLGNLQYHFSTRDVLLQALLSAFLDEYEQELTYLATQPSGNLQADLTKLFVAVFSNPNFEECGFVFKELWAEAQHHEDMKDAMEAYYKRLSSFYATILSGVSDASPNAPEVKKAVSLLVPLLEGFCITGNVTSYTDKQVAKSWAQMFAGVLGSE